MLDRNHALSGALAGCAIAAISHPTPVVSVLTVITTAGAGCLPDLDEPGSAVADTFGGISRAASHAVKTVAHGHRRGTHTILAAAIVTAIVGVCAITFPAITSVVMVGILTAIAFRCAAPKRWRRSIYGLILAVGMAIVASRYSLGILTVACVGTGYILHLFGDVITASGTPIFLPFSEYKVKLPVLGRVGSWRERVAGILIITGLVISVWFLFHHLIPTYRSL